MRGRVLLVVMMLCVWAPALALAGAIGDEPAATDSLAVEDEVPVSDDAFARGLYFGVGGGLAYQNFDDSIEFHVRESVGHDPETVSGTVNLRAGYRVHPYVSGEVQWEYYTGWEPDVRSYGRSEIDGWSLTGNVKAYATQSRFRPFALVGVGVARLEPKKKYEYCARPGGGPDCKFHRAVTGVVARFGIGLDFEITEAWQIGVETAYVLAEADLQGFDYITSGLSLVYNLR